MPTYLTTLYSNPLHNTGLAHTYSANPECAHMQVLARVCAETCNCLHHVLAHRRVCTFKHQGLLHASACTSPASATCLRIEALTSSSAHASQMSDIKVCVSLHANTSKSLHIRRMLHSMSGLPRRWRIQEPAPLGACTLKCRQSFNCWHIYLQDRPNVTTFKNAQICCTAWANSQLLMQLAFIYKI